jgi:hypothetical protein
MWLRIMIAIVKRNAKNIIDGLLDEGKWRATHIQIVQDSYIVCMNSNLENITNKTEQPGY